jgi:hypothetical protein
LTNKLISFVYEDGTKAKSKHKDSQEVLPEEGKN